MKIVAELINTEWLETINEVDIWLVGLQNFSYNSAKEYSIVQLNKLLALKKTKKIALNLEKIYHEADYEKLDNLFKLIDQEKIDYYFYSDLGIYTFLKELNLTNKAIYHCSSMMTNYYDLALSLKENANVVLGKEISLSEIAEIDAKLSQKIMIDAFGKFPIFYSKRNLLSLYFTYRDLKLNPKDTDYSLIEETREEAYPIEENDGTIIYENKFYYLGEDIFKFQNIEYALILGKHLDEAQYLQIIKLHHKLYSTHQPILDELNQLVALYKGKLETKTVIRKAKINDEKN